jgi:hypothetical protein
MTAPVRINPPRALDEVFPELVEPLRRALEAEREPGLAASVDNLRVYSLDGCGDDFCGSFYTVDPPAPVSYSIMLDDDSPFTPFAIDVSDGQISFVEIIHADTLVMADFKRRYVELLDDHRQASG